VYRDELEAVRAERDHLKVEARFRDERIEELERLNEAHRDQISYLQRGVKAEVWDRAKPWFILVPILIGALTLVMYLSIRSHRDENVKANARCLRIMTKALRENNRFITDKKLTKLRARVKFLENSYGHLIVYEGQSFAQAVAEAGGVPVDKLHHSSYAKMVGFDEMLTGAFNTVVKLNDELYARIRRIDSPLFSLWATGVACAINYGEQCVWCSENDDRELTGRCGCVVYDDPDPEECGPRDDCTNCGGDGRAEPQESIETYVRRAVLMHAKQTLDGLG